MHYVATLLQWHGVLNDSLLPTSLVAGDGYAGLICDACLATSYHQATTVRAAFTT